MQGLFPALSVISEVEESSSNKAHKYHFAEPETWGAIPSQEEGGGGRECARRVEARSLGVRWSLEIANFA